MIAILIEEHDHHADSAAFFAGAERCAIAAHSFSEAYSTLTRQGGPHGYGMPPAKTFAALEQLRTVTTLVGLSASQVFDTMRAYAADGGIGPRLYDRLIGEVAVVHGIPAIVTWNIRHMATLFPNLTVRTPAGVLAQRR